jgi:Carboxypeptidase regulatory-like domain
MQVLKRIDYSPVLVGACMTRGGMNSVVLRSAFSLVLAAACAFAQRDLGTITGTITDSQGAIVPNARVTISEDATGLKYELQTGSNGEYIRPALKPGTYTVTAEAEGFRRTAQQNVILNGGDRIGVSVTLAIGDINQSIEVSTEAPLLQTENTKLGATLNARHVADLPLGGQRTFTFLPGFPRAFCRRKAALATSTGAAFPPTASAPAARTTSCSMASTTTSMSSTS